jgi:hypothetical protein
MARWGQGIRISSECDASLAALIVCVSHHQLARLALGNMSGNLILPHFSPAPAISLVTVDVMRHAILLVQRYNVATYILSS